MKLDNWLSLGMGTVFALGGVAIIVFRTQIARFYATIYGSVNNKIGETYERASKPSRMLVPGIAALVIGLASVTMGLLRHNW
jgi:hypothetical protein